MIFKTWVTVVLIGCGSKINGPPLAERNNISALGVAQHEGRRGTHQLQTDRTLVW